MHLDRLHRLRGGIDDRFVAQEQLLLAQRIAEMLFKPATEDGFIFKLAGEEAVLPAPVILGGIKRKVGRAHDFLAAHAIMRSNRDTDRGADDAAPFLERIGLAQHGDDLGRQLAKFAAIVDIGQHHLEFIAAQPADLAFAVDRTREARGDLLEQLVPRRMAERVIDVLEAVEIEHHHRAIALGGAKRGQRIVDQVRHAVAVAEAGERIIARQPRGFLLAEEFVGDVGAGAAKAGKARVAGEHRLARQAQHRAIGLAGRAHRHASEGLVRPQHQRQRFGPPLAIGRGEDRRQRLAQQIAQRHIEPLGNRGRDIGQLALRIARPEPAEPGSLELVEHRQPLAIGER